MRTPDAFDTQAQAAAWLIRLDTDNSAATLAQWRLWLTEDARHRAAYLRLEHSWHQADRLKKLQPLDGTVNASLLDTFPGMRTIGEAQASPVSRPEVESRAPATALALTTLILAALLVIVISGRGVHRTGLGGFERLVLPDGSTILLNTDSEIHVRLTGKRREIVLTRGEALFDVAHDERRPFEVAAGEATVRAVGTSFVVRLRARRQIEVLVVRGRVAINPESSTGALSTLTAGEDVTIDADRERRHVERIGAESITHRLAWTQGQLWFRQNTPLAEVVAEFNRYNRRQLVVSDPALAKLRIGGSFQATDPEAFVTALGQMFAIRAFPSPPDDSGREVIRLLGPEPQFVR
jgi:transmembrane sensor